MKRNFCIGLAIASVLSAAGPIFSQGFVDAILHRKNIRKVEAVEKFTEEMLVDGARKEKALLWYAGTSPVHKVLLKAFQDKYPFLKADAVYLGGPTLNQRFYAEKERGVDSADVFSSGLTEVYPDLRAKGYLAKVSNLPHWVGYPDWAKDKKGAYAFFQATRHCIFYNTDLVKDEDAPDSFESLTDPKWRNKVTMVDPETGGTGTYFARFAATNPRLGFRWMEKMRENGTLLSYQTGQLTEAVNTGRRPLGIGRTVEAVEARQSGAPLKYKIAKEGFAYQFATASVNSRAPHPYAARLFADWLLSDEARQAMEKAGYEGISGDIKAIQAQGGWILDVETVSPKETQRFMREASKALKGE